MDGVVNIGVAESGWYSRDAMKHSESKVEENDVVCAERKRREHNETFVSVALMRLLVRSAVVMSSLAGDVVWDCVCKTCLGASTTGSKTGLGNLGMTAVSGDVASLRRARDGS